MVFEGLDGALGGITMMEFGSDKLVLHFPCVFNGGLEVGTEFIVEDLEIKIVATIG